MGKQTTGKKSKRYNRFNRVFKGYDAAAVEEFILTEQAKSAEIQSVQRDRVAALKTECERLNGELQVLRAREEQIKATLMAATEKAHKTELDIKFRYATELERLKLFRAKWTGAYEEIKERYHFSKDALNMESVAVTTELEIQKFLAQDFSLSKGDETDVMETQFKSESERLTSVDNKVLELKQKLVEASERKEAAARKEATENCRSKTPGNAAFSLEDALNPKESLEDICKYLGINAKEEKAI